MRSVQKIPVLVKSGRGRKLLEGTYGVCGGSSDNLGVWDSLCCVDDRARVYAVITNTSNYDQVFPEGALLGFFQPIPSEDVIHNDIPQAEIDEVFADFSKEPLEPYKGPCRQKLSAVDLEYLTKNLQIKSPQEYFSRYQQLLFDYHDTCVPNLNLIWVVQTLWSIK